MNSMENLTEKLGFLEYLPPMIKEFILILPNYNISDS